MSGTQNQGTPVSGHSGSTPHGQALIKAPGGPFQVVRGRFRLVSDTRAHRRLVISDPDLKWPDISVWLNRSSSFHSKGAVTTEEIRVHRSDQTHPEPHSSQAFRY